MANLYITLFQFGSQQNALNFVNNNQAIDASVATVFTAAGIPEGTWVAAFPEDLSQIPSGFSPVFVYNGNTQMVQSFAPFLDVSTLSIFVPPDNTPVYYRGVPVTNQANGPDRGQFWIDETPNPTPGYAPWNVQFVYPVPTIEILVNGGGVGGITGYEFGANNPSGPLTTPYPPQPPWSQAGIVEAGSQIVVTKPSSAWIVPAPITADFVSGPARDFTQFGGDPFAVANCVGTVITVYAAARPASDFTGFFQPEIGVGISGIFAVGGALGPLPGTSISLDVSGVTVTDPQGNNYVFQSIANISHNQDGSAVFVTAKFKAAPHP